MDNSHDSNKPVAWIYSHGKAKVVSVNYVPGVRATPLYTSPPAQRTWVGLTDAEWMNIVNKDHAWFGQRPEDVAHEVAKLIEAKLKEKNT